MGDFFVKASNTKPFLKVALEGFAGSGKTNTAARLAIGLHKKIGSKKPIVMFDTEKASKFLISLFDEAKIELVVRESRTFADLEKTMDYMEQGYSDILIIDSISHVWEEVLASYKRDKNKEYIYLNDWGFIKPYWKSRFAERLVHDHYHVMLCGRAGYEYESERNDQNKLETFKSGIKMRVEGETAYESDILILMERYEDLLKKDVKDVWRTATIIKDRSGLIDGKMFTYKGNDPTTKVYDDFAPVIDYYLDNPAEYKGSDANDTHFTDKTKYAERYKIILEKILAELFRVYPSSSVKDKKGKQDLVEEVFGTTSWTELEKMRIDDLEEKFEVLAEIVRNRMSDNPVE